MKNAIIVSLALVINFFMLYLINVNIRKQNEIEYLNKKISINNHTIDSLKQVNILYSKEYNNLLNEFRATKK